jgi:hypothetical protein
MSQPVFGLDRALRYCQAIGCYEIARPWGYVVDFGPVELEVYLCARHESEARRADTTRGVERVHG